MSLDVPPLTTLVAADQQEIHRKPLGAPVVAGNLLESRNRIGGCLSIRLLPNLEKRNP